MYYARAAASMGGTVFMMTGTKEKGVVAVYVCTSIKCGAIHGLCLRIADA